MGFQKQKYAEGEFSSPIQQYHMLKVRARRHASLPVLDVARLSLARSFSSAVITSYWKAVGKKAGVTWDIQALGLSLPALTGDASATAHELGLLVASFPVEDAGYLIGSIYTVMLPDAMRSEMGAYYTPPPMVSRLLDLAGKAGIDFRTCTAVDPACGGGAFLAPVGLRMLRETTRKEPSDILEDIVGRLRGIELDPFAAWMTQVLIEAALLPLCASANRRFPQVVTIGDALTHDEIGTYDLVIGNPPYGRVKLDGEMRAKYARSLYGHSNLYGLFTDLALRLVKPKGAIAYLTPTSFLGGQYYKALRKILAQETTPYAFDFISDRNGVFDDVLQETILVAYKVGKSRKKAAVSMIVPQGIEQAQIESIGTASIPTDGSPWIIPRSAADTSRIGVLSKMPVRLADFGYQISTGQLVWNRHKPQLRNTPKEGLLPIIWAESVTAAGFSFSAVRRNHAPFIELQGQPHLITKKSCILLQRTTAKEQERRLLSAVIPQAFIDRTGGVVVENHLNIIYAPKEAKVSPEAVSAILNSKAVDRAFRCINGSVAVSAYELEALPMPTLEEVVEVEALLKREASAMEIEKKISSFYEREAR
ncbi:Eco57I restriction-modification methylase domain-containing protein [Rhizobium sp. RU36D]|uniref:HsdM family class I SAM-dependent methyltransferase n=1 Tax=Rhizobium sp. RU36D TaxID=1907415 RepID=UPI0009D83979|nr:Eco57I restriction-modification methylase domain-containing protein [Rhizobium sp. RU36D]SMD16262.1 Eco57I restriction-modification methylase [Rhizobium sp. RU36D]